MSYPSESNWPLLGGNSPKMHENKRAHPRYRTEVVLDFVASEQRVTGMTWDVSMGGLFVRTSRMPEVGQKLLVTLRFQESQLLIQGEVVRTFNPPALLRAGLPAGFAVTVKNGDGYKRFVESVAANAATGH